MRLVTIFFIVFVLLIGAITFNAYQEKWALVVIASILTVVWMIYTVLFFRARSR